MNDGLELVLLFAGHADLSILQLTLHLEILGFDRLNDFLFIDFGKNIERRHRRRFGYGLCAVILTLPSCASNSKVVLPPPATNMSTVLIGSACRCSFSAKSLAIFPVAVCATR